MSRKTEDLTGRRFGRLKALERDRSRTGSHAYWLVVCLPEYGGCGNSGSVTSNGLRSGLTTSCGCVHREMLLERNGGSPASAPPRQPFTPKPRGGPRKPRAPRGRGPGAITNGTAQPTQRGAGLTKRYKTTYASWHAMIGRCTNPQHPRYADWGGRGITVCGRWLEFSAFLADMGERPAGTTLEREKNDLGYGPDNCVWATPAEQGRNTRRFKLKPDAVRKIRFLQAAGHTVNEIADVTGVGRHTVGTVLTVFAFLDANPAEVLADIAGIPEDTAQAFLLAAAAAREDGQAGTSAAPTVRTG